MVSAVRKATLQSFPREWEKFFDEALTHWVKERYSPKEQWKGKPFVAADAAFFSRGIKELSEHFTVDRPDHRGRPTYFQHPRFQSSYLLYFLPLQVAKFIALFEMHADVMASIMANPLKRGKLFIQDVGAGPGTASIALLFWLHSRWREKKISVELNWVDLYHAIMKIGKEILLSFPGFFPGITVSTSLLPWWKASTVIHPATSMVFFGNVLNEDGREDHEKALETILAIQEKAREATILFVEPATRQQAQYLARLRDNYLEDRNFPGKRGAVLGPCLHEGPCPLTGGRDWCHFSVPAKVPGKWFSYFSTKLGSEREWLKFSYLWLAPPGFPAPVTERGWKRVISDPLRSQRGSEVLLCEPGRPGRLELGHHKLKRGDCVLYPGKRS